MVKHTYRPPPPRSGTKWRCATCRKIAYSTWRFANWDAVQQQLKGNRRERAYWSKRCRAYHVGSQQPRKKP